MDESGDRGAKGSKYLVTTLLCTSECQKIIKIIRNAKQALLMNNKCAKWLNRNGGEIKFYGFPDEVLLRRIMKQLSELDIKIYSLVFEKDKDVDDISKIFLLNQLFWHIFNLSEGKVPQRIFADSAFYGREKIRRFLLHKYMSSSEVVKDADGQPRNEQREEIQFSIIDDDTYVKIKNDKNMIITMEQYNSRLKEELQALDLIGGSIFHKYERGDDFLFNTIKSKIIRIVKIKASEIKNSRK